MMDGLDLIGCEKHWTDIKGLGRPVPCWRHVGRLCEASASSLQSGGRKIPSLVLSGSKLLQFCDRFPLWPRSAHLTWRLWH